MASRQRKRNSAGEDHGKAPELTLEYEGGYTSYLEVLDAARNLFSAELHDTQTQAAMLTSLISLYLAMGGGWFVQAKQMTAPAPTNAQSQLQTAASQPILLVPQ